MLYNIMEAGIELGNIKRNRIIHEINMLTRIEYVGLIFGISDIYSGSQILFEYSRLDMSLIQTYEQEEALTFTNKRL